MKQACCIINVWNRLANRLATSNLHETGLLHQTCVEETCYIKPVWRRLATSNLCERGLLHQTCMKQACCIINVWNRLATSNLHETGLLHHKCVKEACNIKLVWTCRLTESLSTVDKISVPEHFTPQTWDLCYHCIVLYPRLNPVTCNDMFLASVTSVY